MDVFPTPIITVEAAVTSGSLHINLTFPGGVLELDVPLERVALKWKEGRTDQQKPQPEASR